MDKPRSGPERSRQRGWHGEQLAAAFAAASRTKPWTMGYRSFDEERASSVAQSSGSWPRDLRGVLFRNGPARHERGGQRYGHRWDGDGMVQRFAIGDDGVRHLGRFVHTRKYLAESEAGRLLFSGFGTQVPGSQIIPESLDDFNPANISVIHHAGELWALWEAGSPYRLDPTTLETLGMQGWSPTIGRPFSAHPRKDEHGALWNFGIDPLHDQLTVYHVAPDAKLLGSRTLKVDRLPAAHDFGITRHYLVFLLPPLIVNAERLLSGASFAESAQWKPDLGMRVVLLDKEDGSHRVFQAPAGCLFHVANAWEDDRGRVHVHYMRSDDPMSLIAGWTVMAGDYRHQEGSRLTWLTIDPSSGAVEQVTVGEQEGEFPSVLPDEVGVRHRTVASIERSPTRPADLPGYDQVSVFDADKESWQRFDYGERWLVEEHLLVPAAGGRASPWVIGCALDLDRGNTVVSVFDAARLSEGPLAQARLPYALPLGLHGTFVPQAR